MTTDAATDDLLRVLTPQVVGALVRRYGHFDIAEDAAQEALLAAATQWPREGVPDDPRAWTIRVASRRMTDMLRADRDDSLLLLFLCCHPSLSVASQIALTLRVVGGLTTSEIAHAFLVPETTMAQRISRAKQRVVEAGGRFRMPSADGYAERLGAVLHVLYLVFNEGYTATSGSSLQRKELSGEAIRLTRMFQRMLPANGEVTGLLALMLLTDARGPARTHADGDLVPLSEQDRSLWDRGQISEGRALVDEALSHGKPGSYQLQAAMAAVHAAAERAEDTDWQQILRLYELLERIEDNPVVVLNHAVAAAMVNGPQAGLDMLSDLEHDSRMSRTHRLDAVRAHLLEMVGDEVAAIAFYRQAAGRTTSPPERRYLEGRAVSLESKEHKNPSGRG